MRYEMQTKNAKELFFEIPENLGIGPNAMLLAKKKIEEETALLTAKGHLVLQAFSEARVDAFAIVVKILYMPKGKYKEINE